MNAELGINAVCFPDVVWRCTSMISVGVRHDFIMCTAGYLSVLILLARTSPF